MVGLFAIRRRPEILGFRGLGFGFWGLGLGVRAFRVAGLGLRFQGLGLRVLKSPLTPEP